MAGAAETWAAEALTSLAARGLRRALEPLRSPQGPVIHIGEERLINFSSNDYLSLSADLRLREAAQRAAQRHGVGSGASRLIVGDSLAHRALESTLARWLRTPAALLFNSGYAAHVGLLSTLAQEGDVLFSDALNHASLIDGCRLSKARTVVYAHADAADLARKLDAHPGRRQLIVTDSIFSMDGDQAPLRALHALASARGAALIVDEAHALGVLGPHGAGACAALGVEPDVRMGTLGKSLGCYGAFVATSAPVAEWLVNRARSLIFSTSLPAMLCEVAREAAERVQADEALRERLWSNIRRFAKGLQALGLPAHERSAIFSVVLGAPQTALEASGALRTRGVLAKAIRPPTVPEGTSRLRFAVCAGHTEAHVDAALEALSSLKVLHGRGRAA